MSELNDQPTPSYGDLVNQGRDMAKYPDRPGFDAIAHEADYIARNEVQFGSRPIYGNDAGAVADRRRLEVSQENHKLFSGVAKTGDVSPLVGTRWEAWQAEDCQQVLAAIEEKKVLIKTENNILSLFITPPHDILEAVDRLDATTETSDVGSLEDSAEKIEALIVVIQKALDGSSEERTICKKIFGDFSRDQMDELLKKAQEISKTLEDMIESEHNSQW